MDNTERAEQQEMSFIAHLRELRTRILHSLIVFGLTFAVFFVFANDLYQYISKPLRLLLPQGATMIATDVTAPFFAPLKLAMFASFVVSMPVLLYQLWRFIAPGLYANEKRFAFPMLFMSIFLFYAGMAFAYYVVFQLLFGFFLTTGPQSVMPMTDVSNYLHFVVKVLIGFGLAFQVPIATILLLRVGLVSRRTLKRQRPYIFVGCFVLGMLLTPPDMISQTLLAVPMWLLFEIGLLVDVLYRGKDIDKKKKTNSFEEK